MSPIQWAILVTAILVVLSGIAAIVVAVRRKIGKASLTDLSTALGLLRTHVESIGNKEGCEACDKLAPMIFIRSKTQ